MPYWGCRPTEPASAATAVVRAQRQLFEVLDDMQKVYQERLVELEAEREDELARILMEEVSFEEMLCTFACVVINGTCATCSLTPVLIPRACMR